METEAVGKQEDESHKLAGKSREVSSRLPRISSSAQMATTAL